MKNKKTGVIVMLICCFLLLVACKGSNETTVNASLIPQNTTDKTITVEDAQNKALTHSKVNAANVKFVTAELNEDENIYEVEFYEGNTEYDYEIDAATGEIISFDNDIDDFATPVNHKKSTHHDESDYTKKHHDAENCPNSITENNAKAISLAHAGFQEEDVTDIHVSYGFDNGHHVYEVKFIKGNTKYEHEIAACTGAILSCKMDKK